MPTVTIIDYGVGNLLSVRRAFEHVGAQVELTDSPEQVASAQLLVLPGVGAFADAMAGLRGRGLVEPIKEFCNKGRSFLGICLGMQMMLDSSEEFGNHEGLGLIPGTVNTIPATGIVGQSHKIPHIGWNNLVSGHAETDWGNTILMGIRQETPVYFIHSFMAIPNVKKNVLAYCSYNGRNIAAVIRSGNMYGCQFHPEKSGQYGLKIISNFLQLDIS